MGKVYRELDLLRYDILRESATVQSQRPVRSGTSFGLWTASPAGNAWMMAA